jgi:hypothetical protein
LAGTGKTHLLTALCVAACRQTRRVRFATAKGLINELVEAQHPHMLRRAPKRWSRYGLVGLMKWVMCRLRQSELSTCFR